MPCLTRRHARTCQALLFGASLSVIAVTAPALSEEEEIEVITITAKAWPSVSANISDARTDDGAMRPAADAGDFLRQMPGVDAGRGSGHGLDPVIRGQQQNQLNVMIDGTFQWGGGPNRMDPPTATSSLEKADKVEVIRGYQSVIHGPGGSGGTIRLIREAPEFEDDTRYTLKTSTAFVSNSESVGFFAKGAARIGKNGWARVTGHYKDADNYTDGDGNEVRSSFLTYGSGLELGYRGTDTDLVLSYDNDVVNDALFPGAAMDSILDDTTAYRLKGTREFSGERLNKISFAIYDAHVDHVMDDYHLRPHGPMVRRAYTSSATEGGKLALTFDALESEITFGIDSQTNLRNARLHMGMEAMILSPMTERLILWPDVELSTLGFFAESVKQVSSNVKLTVGVRYDQTDASAGAAHIAATNAMRTPNQAYQLYYGTDFSRAREEENVGGLARLDIAISDKARIFGGFGRSYRTADATERGMARDFAGSMMSMMGWIGNPGLAPEEHNQIDFGFSMKDKNWTFNLATYHDDVTDFILRDRARGQAGVLLSDGATIYRNVEALLTGVEMLGIYRTGDWQLSADLTYTRGQNETDNMPLAQIPPVSGSVEALLDRGKWMLGGRVNYALEQTRVDDNMMFGSGRDAGPSPDWATFDLFGSLDATEKVRVEFGVTNLFDKAYSNHLNRENIFDATSVQIAEPGRSLYLRFRAAL